MSSDMLALSRTPRRAPQLSDEEVTAKALAIGYELGMRLMSKNGDLNHQKFMMLLHKEVTEYRMTKTVRRLIKRASEKARQDWRKVNVAPKS